MLESVDWYMSLDPEEEELMFVLAGPRQISTPEPRQFTVKVESSER